MEDAPFAPGALMTTARLGRLQSRPLRECHTVATQQVSSVVAAGGSRAASANTSLEPVKHTHAVAAG